MPREYIHRRRVEFHETDLAGIVHFSNFFRYMEAAESEFLRHLGLSIHEASETGTVGWPRGEVSCRFTAPLRFGDEFEVHLSVARISARTITYQCVFHRLEVDRTTEAASGTSTAIHVEIEASGKQLKTTMIPVRIRERIEAYFEIKTEDSASPASQTG
jgi:acyl-CoA thioester hydrolase